MAEIEVLALKKLYSCDGWDNYLDSYGSVGRNHITDAPGMKHKRSVVKGRISLMGRGSQREIYAFQVGFIRIVVPLPFSL